MGQVLLPFLEPSCLIRNRREIIAQCGLALTKEELGEKSTVPDKYYLRPAVTWTAGAIRQRY